MRRAAAGLVLALAGSGCAVAVQRPLERRAYDQALCAADRSRDRDEALSRVGSRLDAEARPRLHLYAIPRAELERTLGEAGRRLADRAVVVRAVVAIDGVQVDDFGVRVALTGPGGAVASLPARVDVLAPLVGETIPPDRVRTDPGGRTIVAERFRQRPLLGIAAGIVEASTLMLLPVTQLTGHVREEGPRTVVLPPTEDEVRAAAPVASLLAEHAAALSHTRQEEGLEVASVWLWPRPTTDDVTIHVEWSYAAYGCADRRPALRRRSTGQVELVRTATVRLPPGLDLESRIFTVFGDRMRLLAR
jgi:hypothetical protein